MKKIWAFMVKFDSLIRKVHLEYKSALYNTMMLEAKEFSVARIKGRVRLNLKRAFS